MKTKTKIAKKAKKTVRAASVRSRYGIDANGVLYQYASKADLNQAVKENGLKPIGALKAYQMHAAGTKLVNLRNAKVTQPVVIERADIDMSKFAAAFAAAYSAVTGFKQDVIPAALHIPSKEAELAAH